MWCSYLFVFFAVVDGHSILRTPAAWNARESKRAPCGGANAVAAAAKVEVGQTIQARWEVTAGDGNGPVTAKFASAANNGAAVGASTNTIPLTFATVPARGTGNYPFTFTIPAAMAEICKGGADGASCDVQFKSTSNWYSCTTISMNAAVVETQAPTKSPITTPTTGAPTKDICTNYVAAMLPYCSKVAGKRVFKFGDGSLADSLTFAKTQVDDNRLNPLVFRNGATPECAQAYEDWLCSDKIFSPCLGTTEQLFAAQKVGNAALDALLPYACLNRCKIRNSVCDLDPSHDLAFGPFKCDSANVNADAAGTCPANSAVPQRKIHLKNRLVGNPAPEGDFWGPKTKEFITMFLYPGDKLTFKYKAAESDLKRFASTQAFQQCDFTGATTPAGLPTQPDADGFLEFVWTTPANVGEGGSDFMFGSSITGSCKTPVDGKEVVDFSQKVMVTVVQIPTGASLIPIEGEAPEIVTDAPTKNTYQLFPPTPEVTFDPIEESGAVSFVAKYAVFLSFFMIIFN